MNLDIKMDSGHFGSRFLHSCFFSILLEEIPNFGTASYQLSWSKLVLHGDYVVQKGEVSKL